MLIIARSYGQLGNRLSLYAHLIAAARHHGVPVSNPCFNQADVVVGAHIRQNDYETYLNGKYFYSTEQYARAMRGVAEQMPGERVAFLVCRNTQLDRRYFVDLQVHLKHVLSCTM